MDVIGPTGSMSAQPRRGMRSPARPGWFAWPQHSADRRSARALFNAAISGCTRSPRYGAYGLWKSTNGGVDWVSVFPPDSMIGKIVQNATFVKSISIDFSNHQHVVASMHANCLAPYDASCHAESTDGRASWMLMKNPMGDPWAEDTPSFALNGDSILLLGAVADGHPVADPARTPTKVDFRSNENTAAAETIACRCLVRWSRGGST
jgi:hypothetical protein